MKVICQLLSLSRVCVPLHDVFPLLEDFHCVELLKEWQVFKYKVADSIGNELLISHNIRHHTLAFSDINEAILAEYHNSSMIIGSILHFLVHQGRVYIGGSLERNENLVL